MVEQPKGTKKPLLNIEIEISQKGEYNVQRDIPFTHVDHRSPAGPGPLLYEHEH